MAQFPGLEILIEELQEDRTLLDRATEGVKADLREILYSTLLGMNEDERRRLLKICLSQDVEYRSFLINTIGNGLIDTRTGLYNRTKFNTDLKAAIEVVDQLYRNKVHSQDSKKRERAMLRPFQEDDVSLLLMDIDKFKHVNDVYGHSVGDRVLAVVAELAKQSLRTDDHQRIYRYGGEEFAVLLPYTSPNNALLAASRVIRNIEERLTNALPAHNGYAPRGITVSIGVANYRKTTADPSELVDQADLALYAAKDAGRNCVKVYSPTMLQGSIHERYLEKQERQ